MLTLLRKVGQSILIGNDIEIAVMGIERGRVRIAISAPKQISIRREPSEKEKKQPPAKAKSSR